MKNGRYIVLDRVGNRDAAVLLLNNRIEDVLIDPADDQPNVGAIYRARVGQAMKGQGGVVVDLGAGQKGFLRGAKGMSPGHALTVQVTTYAEDGKAAPVTDRIIYKSLYAIVTPDAPGLNVARTIRDDDERDRLQEIAHDAMADAPEGFGLILRSACEGAARDDIMEDIATMAGAAMAVVNDASTDACLLIESTAQDKAFIAWGSPAADEIIDDEGSFDHLGILDHFEHIKSDRVPLKSGGAFFVESTRALVAVDVNTGTDFSLQAGLKANMECARTLPRALRLRGLGGQIVLDLAPMPKKDRRAFETALRSSLKADGIDTVLVGWTPLGHYELQRKRERLPTKDLL